MPNALLNLLFPPQCLNCDMLVPTHGTLCLPCWQQIRFITEPMCACCGLPFEYSLGAQALCGECLKERPPYAAARAAFCYDEASRALVLKFKYHDQTYLAGIYGNWLVKAGREMIEQSDYIVPVPLHYWRFVGRRYNQSAMLAATLSKRAHIPALLDGLLRTRQTRPQTELNFNEREKNVKGAFSVNAKRKAALKDKTILLIDDVMTSGATIEQCARALLKAGAMRVNVLTLARTMR